MLRDIEGKCINAVVCLALSRISRSTKDLLELVEFFRHHGVDFICLKEDVDRTTPMGRLLLTFMGALNQFEREQTGDRTRSACVARAERGLWNGGQIIGYTLDPMRKGNLLINEAEAEIIRFGFRAYLERGSVLKTRDLLNQRGYKTKSYTTRRGNIHASARFSHASVHQMLTNLTYIGKRYVRSIGQKPVGNTGADEKDRIVDAVWSPLLDNETFYEVQNLLKQNLKTRNNGSCPTKHFYLLNAGFIYCMKCGTQMEGRNGHGHKGRKAYYYYVCRNRECRFKIPQTEAEGAIYALMSEAAKESQILPRVVEKLNRK